MSKISLTAAVAFVVLALALMLPSHVASQVASVAEQLRRLAAMTTHFATGDIVSNRRSERRWPAELLKEQDDLAVALRGLSAERDSLLALLRDPDPRVRTLALGALFMREDPQDLPLIAGLRTDNAATFPDLHASANSAPFSLPLSGFEAPQSVGAVATAMIASWLDAAHARNFETYWPEHEKRERATSWFLVRMRRATRQTSPLQPGYMVDIQRVLSEIRALPPIERAWTMLYVRSGVSLSDSAELISDNELVTALKVVGPDALMRLLHLESPTDDPDIPSHLTHVNNELSRFVVAHARDLLRPGDADVLLQLSTVDPSWNNPTMWRAAASELLSLVDSEASAESLKREIAAIPLRGYSGQYEQAALAVTLWRVRGAKESAFLTNWFYTALPLAGQNHGPEWFLRSVEKEMLPETPSLLRAIVADARFDRTDFESIARIFSIVNRTLPAPLVDTRTLYDNQPNSYRRDQREKLASWRNVLRAHFGLPAAPTVPGNLTTQRIVSAPSWSLPLEKGSRAWAPAVAVSPDGRFLATVSQGTSSVTTRNAINGEPVAQSTTPGMGDAVVVFPPNASRPVLFTFTLDFQRLQRTSSNGQNTVWNEMPKTYDSLGAVDLGLTRYVSAAGIFDLTKGSFLWRPPERLFRAQAAISADGRVMAIGGGEWPKIARVLDATSGKLLFESLDFSSPVVGLALTPDGSLLAAVSHGDPIRIWNVARGELLRRLPYPIDFIARDRPALVISPDGRLLALSTRSSVAVFDLSSGDLRSEVRLPAESATPAIAFSPDNKILYTADSRLAAWRLE